MYPKNTLGYTTGYIQDTEICVYPPSNARIHDRLQDTCRIQVEYMHPPLHARIRQNTNRIRIGGGGGGAAVGAAATVFQGQEGQIQEGS